MEQIDPLISPGPQAEIVLIKGLIRGSQWGAERILPTGVDNTDAGGRLQGVGMMTYRRGHADELSMSAISQSGYQEQTSESPLAKVQMRNKLI